MNRQYGRPATAHQPRNPGALHAAFCPQLRTASRRTRGTLDGVDTLFLHVDALLLTAVRNSSTALTTTLATVAPTWAQLWSQPRGNFAAIQLQRRRHATARSRHE